MKHSLVPNVSLERTSDKPKPLNHAVEVKYFELPVDHFDDANTDRWKMRYMENDAFFKPESPVYIMVGNHGEMNNDTLVEGIMFNLAKETNGMMYATEHRYYGKSQVKADIKYLHTSQALLDLKNFIDCKKADEKFKNSKFVLVGEEYGASIAVWLKQKHPELVDVVIADTALLLAKLEYEQFVEQVANNYIQHAPAKCLIKILDVFNQYNSLLNDTKKLHSYSKACPNVDMSKKFNQHVMFYHKGTLFKEAAEDGLKEIVDSCNFIDLDNGIKHNDKSECYNYDYDSFVEGFKNKNSDEHFILYQSCNEFASFITTLYFKDPFGDMIPIEFYVKLCTGVFEYDGASIERKVTETNKLFGGLRPNVTNVIFVHGEMDPWKHLGITDPDFKNNKVITIKGESHGKFLEGDDVNKDSAELKSARLEVMKTAKEWIGGSGPNSCSY